MESTLKDGIDFTQKSSILTLWFKKILFSQGKQMSGSIVPQPGFIFQFLYFTTQEKVFPGKGDGEMKEEMM